jgi:hypothetical protein
MLDRLRAIIIIIGPRLFWGAVMIDVAILVAIIAWVWGRA